MSHAGDAHAAVSFFVGFTASAARQSGGLSDSSLNNNAVGCRGRLSWPLLWTVRELVPQNPRRKSRAHNGLLELQGSNNLAMADDVGGGQSCNFRRQHEVNLELGVGLNRFLSPEQHSRTADVFGSAIAPDAFAQQPVFQRHLKIETLRAGRGGELLAHL